MDYIIEIPVEGRPRTARGLLLAGLVAARAVCRMRLLTVRATFTTPRRVMRRPRVFARHRLTWRLHPTLAQERNRRLRQDLRGEVFIKSRLLPILFHRCQCAYRADYFCVGSHTRIAAGTIRAVVTNEDRMEITIHAGEYEQQPRSYHLRVASSSAEFSRLVYALRRLAQQQFVGPFRAPGITDGSVHQQLRKRQEAPYNGDEHHLGRGADAAPCPKCAQWGVMCVCSTVCVTCEPWGSPTPTCAARVRALLACLVSALSVAVTRSRGEGRGAGGRSNNKRAAAPAWWGKRDAAPAWWGKPPEELVARRASTSQRWPRWVIVLVVIVFCCNRLPPYDYLRARWTLPRPQQREARLRSKAGIVPRQDGHVNRTLPRRPWANVLAGRPPTGGLPPAVILAEPGNATLSSSASRSSWRERVAQRSAEAAARRLTAAQASNSSANATLAAAHI